MLPPKVLNIQNHETRVKAISRVCSAITIFSVLDTVIYLFLNLHVFAMLTGGIGLFFGGVLILNKKGYFAISRASLIVATNLGVLLFSGCLGFKSGIYLYLFAAPLLTYMLFDFKQQFQVYFCFITYILTFLLSYWIDKIPYFELFTINDSQMSLLFNVNIVFSFILCFVLIIYFSHNNSKYTDLLLRSNEVIQEQKNQLEIEISTKDTLNKNLEDTLKDRVLLLSEIHHRVKNNLAVVNALMELQTFYLEDEKTVQILKESQNRIKSIALLHEKLYENKSLKNVDVSSYSHELIHFIKQSLSNKDKNINISININNINLEMTKAMPFGLLLNELVTNSYKYAFINKDTGNIQITVFEKDHDYVLEYKDDGPGFEYNNEAKKSSLGLNLIESFCIQLNGTFVYKNNPNEMVFEFKFPAQKN
ncbi:MAG: sensor histidine kinase [Bacteroidetes bacterium]|nr:sensor histidine kinase [Bacteroidota bacterium]